MRREAMDSDVFSRVERRFTMRAMVRRRSWCPRLEPGQLVKLLISGVPEAHFQSLCSVSRLRHGWRTMVSRDGCCTSALYGPAWSRKRDVIRGRGTDGRI